MTHIHTQTHIQRPIGEVFAYVTAPGNWPQWHPSSLGVHGVLSSLNIGDQVTEAFLVAGRKGEVVWRCLEREAPYRWVIEGRIVGRSNGGTIRYSLSQLGNGTLFQREFVYQTPNALFALLDLLFFRRRIQAESEEALRRLKGRLEEKREQSLVHVGL